MRLRVFMTLGLVAASLPAVAADHDHSMMRHGSHAVETTAAAAPSTKELQQANAAMHKDMDIAYTGDADIDFLRGMIAHHQGAVEMAQVQLRYGRDPKVTRLAEEIIRAQNLEIAWMQKWLVQLEAQPRKPIVTEPHRGAWTDSNWSGKTWLGER